MVYIATDCPDDLRSRTTDEVRFEKPSKETYTRRPRVFDLPYTWFVGSKSGCSCTFRHLAKGADGLGFDVPQDWSPEDPDAVAATEVLYDHLTNMVSGGHRVVLLDCWSGDEDEEVKRLEVSLAVVPRERFRMFEGCLFTLTP